MAASDMRADSGQNSASQSNAAFNNGDAKTLAAAYAPNAKLMPPTHEVAAGPAEIEKFWAGMFANGVTGHKLEVIDAGATARSSTARPTGAPRARTRMASQRPSLATPHMCSSAKRTIR